jgi:hypothetical protein
MIVDNERRIVAGGAGSMTGPRKESTRRPVCAMPSTLRSSLG